MIEHLKNVGFGLWCMGIVCAIAYIFIWLGYLTTEYPAIMVPSLVICVAWALGRFIR